MAYPRNRSHSPKSSDGILEGLFRVMSRCYSLLFCEWIISFTIHWEMTYGLRYLFVREDHRILGSCKPLDGQKLLQPYLPLLAAILRGPWDFPIGTCTRLRSSAH